MGERWKLQQRQAMERAREHHQWKWETLQFRVANRDAVMVPDANSAR